MISTRLGTTCYTIRKTKTSRSLGGILLQTLSHQLICPLGPNSIFDHIPVEFLEEIGVGTALHTEVMGRDMSALADFSTEDFVLNYGTHTFGGKHLFPTISDPLTDTYGDKNNDSQYLVAIDVNGVKTLFTKVSSKDGLNTTRESIPWVFRTLCMRVTLEATTTRAWCIRTQVSTRVEPSMALVR